MKLMLVFSSTSTDSTPLRLTKSDADVYKVQNLLQSCISLVSWLMQLWNISGTGMMMMMMIIWRWGWCLTLKNSVFLLMNTVLGSSLPQTPLTARLFVLSLIIRSSSEENRGLFFPPTSATESLQSQWPQRHLGVPEKAVGTKQWCYSGNTPKHGFRVQRLRMAPSPPGAALRHKDRPVCIEFPLDCGVIVAVTEQRHRGALSPASSLKGPEHFPPPLPSTNDELDSLVRSQRLSFSSSRVFPFFFPFTGWRGCVRRRWWRRGWSGPRQTPEPPAVPCPSLPPGTPPPPPRLRGRKHTSAALTHTASKQMGGRTNTAVCHGLSPLPQSVHSRPGAQRTNTSTIHLFHPSIGARFTPGSEFFFCLCGNIYQNMAERWCEARHTATHCVDSPPFPQLFVTLVLTIWCSLSRQLTVTQRNFLWISYPEFRLWFKTKQNREMQLDLKTLNSNDYEVWWEQTILQHIFSSFCYSFGIRDLFPFLSGLFLSVWSRCWKKVTLTSVKQIGQIFACWLKNRAVILSCVSFSSGYLRFETRHSGVLKEWCFSSEHHLTFPSPLLGWDCCSVLPQGGVHREGGGCVLTVNSLLSPWLLRINNKVSFYFTVGVGSDRRWRVINSECPAELPPGAQIDWGLFTHPVIALCCCELKVMTDKARLG